jgi:hypothetical protein
VSGPAGRPAPWRTSQTSAAQSRSSVLERRDPSWVLAAWVSEGANSRTDPGQRRSSSATQAWWNRPVASTPISGGSGTPLAPINPARASTPSRSTGNDTGSPIRPRSPLVNQTRLLTLLGSTATTSAVAGTAWRSSSTTSHLLTNRKGPPC